MKFNDNCKTMLGAVDYTLRTDAQMQPRHINQCTSCRFIGRLNGSNLYICDGTPHPVIGAVNDDETPDIFFRFSDLTKERLSKNSELYEALRLARFMIADL